MSIGYSSEGVIKGVRLVLITYRNGLNEFRIPTFRVFQFSVSISRECDETFGLSDLH